MELEQQQSASVPNSLSVAVLVLNWNGRSLLEIGLPLLLNQTYPNYEIVVVDNGSTDGSIALVQERFPQVRLIQHGENIGFSRALNEGMRQVDADVIVLLNNDVFAQPDWLAELIRPFSHAPKIGIVGCKLLFPDGTVQHLGAELSYPLGHSKHVHYKQAATAVQDLSTIQDMPYVTGAALAIHRTVREKIGLLDGMFHPIYYEEVDYCYRARAAGFRVVVATKSVAIHDESTSMKRLPDVKLQMLHRNRYRFLLKHYAIKQFLEDFVPAETEYLNQQTHFAEVIAIRMACLEMAILAPTILASGTTLDEVKAVQRGLLQLRQTAVSANAYKKETPLPLQEFSFPRTGSPIQSFIARIRRAWSNIAAKWLMRSLLQQQNLHNVHMLQQIEHLNRLEKFQAIEIDHLINTLLPIQQKQIELQAEFSQFKELMANTLKDKDH